MEGTLNFFKLQSVLKNSTDATDFTKIKYKGGNEEKLSAIVENVRDYFISKKLILNGKSNPEFPDELQNITNLFIVNTQYKHELTDIEEFSHLIKALPLLSKCVLANLIIELNLAEYSCNVISKLPNQIVVELLAEIMICIKVCEPKEALQDTFTFLKTVIKIMINGNDTQNQEEEEVLANLADIVTEMLKNISGINSDWLKKWKVTQVHEHMGHTLLCLFKLLRSCPLHTSSLSRVTDDLIRVSITLLKAVTLNVFCLWAEVKYEHDQPLQIVVAGEAYLVTQHLQKYKPGQELIQMLASIAQKPKTIHEIILEADLSTIISSIDKRDDNQKLWFRAFMNTNVLQNEEALVCLNKWAHLCTQSDIARLLNLSTCHKEPQITTLVIKCARSLSIPDLISVTSRYIREHNTCNLEMESLKDQFTLLFNKAENNSEIDSNFIKEVHLLLLQNVEFVLSALYIECLKKTACANYLRHVFESIKPVVEVHNIYKSVLVTIFKTNPPSSENVTSYTDLLNLLLNLEYFQSNVILCELCLPQLQEFLNEGNFEGLLYMLRLINMISIKHTVNQDFLPVITVLASIMEKTRCQFFTLSVTKQNIVQEVIDFILKYKSLHWMQYKDFLISLKINDIINKFYFTSLYQTLDNQLLSYIYPRFHIDGNAEMLARLIKILPSCVTSEWILITKELEVQCGYQKTLILLKDALMLLCRLTKSKDKEPTGSNGLRFCLQQYGIIIMDVLQPIHTNLEDEILLTKSVCDTLKDIPNDIRRDEGLRLAGLLSHQSLQALKEDKKFILSLVAIGDATVSQLLAKKMLAK